MLMVIGFGALAIQLVLMSPFGGGLQKGIERTFSEDRSSGNRTSGRSDQWVVSYYAFSESVERMIHGYGPGMGQDVYATYSRRIPTVEFKVGSRMALHSLYMQVGVEAGLIGLIPLVGWLLVGLYRAVRWSMIHGLQFPFVCFLGFILAAFTTSGFDTVSGSLLGVGLIATSRRSPGNNPSQVPEKDQPLPRGPEIGVVR
jgi:O-antigen ligase